MQHVHIQPKRTLAFSDIFRKQLGILSPNFTGLLHVPVCVRLQIFTQIISNSDEVMPYLARLPSVRFGRWWTFSAYNGGHT